jgi:hypothetical protein
LSWIIPAFIYLCWIWHLHSNQMFDYDAASII